MTLIGRLLVCISVLAAPLNGAVAQSPDFAAPVPPQVDTTRQADGSYVVQARFPDRIEITNHWPTGQVRSRSVTTATSTSVPENAESTALAAAASLLESERGLASIWPPYWDENHAFGIYPVSGGTLLLWPRQSGPPGPPLDSPGLAAILRGRAYLVDEISDAPFVLDFRANGRVIAAVSVIPPFAESRTNVEDAPWLADPVASLVSFAAHEGFHTYQLASFASVQGSPKSSPAANYAVGRIYELVLEDPETRLALEAERMALRNALLAGTSDQSVSAIRDYLRAKDVRLRRAPPEVRHFEDAQERMEGIANWVGYQAVRVVFQQPLEATLRHLVSDLEGGVPKPRMQGWQGYAQWHLYVTGAAKAELLERLSPNEWRREIEVGASLDDRLHRLVCEAAP